MSKKNNCMKFALIGAVGFVAGATALGYYLYKKHRMSIHITEDGLDDLCCCGADCDCADGIDEDLNESFDEANIHSVDECTYEQEEEKEEI